VAGIGFRLRRLVADDTSGGWLRAHGYGAVLSAGPWLLTVCAVAALAVAGRALVGGAVHDVFAAMIGYTYTATLITTGIGSVVVTRHLADMLYTDDRASILATYRWVIGATALLHAALAAVAYLTLPALATDVRAAGAVLVVIVACNWLATVFASATEDYAGVTVAFLAGNAVAVPAAMIAGRSWGLGGYVAGFAAGQSLVFLGLTARLEASLPDRAAPATALLGAFRRYPALAAVGPFYGLALAIDRMLFWASSEGIVLVGWFRLSAYDAPMFLAYLSVVPALAVFLVGVETDFYEAYRRYYGTVTNHGTLAQVIEAKGGMIRAIHDGIARVLIVQAPVTLALVVFAPAIGQTLGFEPLQVSIFRTLLIGAVPHALTLFGIVVLLYFDQRREALAVTALLCGINAGGTAATLALGPAWYGLGFAIAALTACLLTERLIAKSLHHLEYQTFAQA
jgi:polysaccharide biosynthesis protein PelG